jgi:hypothetical protein
VLRDACQGQPCCSLHRLLRQACRAPTSEAAGATLAPPPCPPIPHHPMLTVVRPDRCTLCGKGHLYSKPPVRLRLTLTRPAAACCKRLLPTRMLAGVMTTGTALQPAWRSSCEACSVVTRCSKQSMQQSARGPCPVCWGSGRALLTDTCLPHTQHITCCWGCGGSQALGGGTWLSSPLSSPPPPLLGPAALLATAVPAAATAAPAPAAAATAVTAAAA